MIIDEFAYKIVHVQGRKRSSHRAAGEAAVRYYIKRWAYPVAGPLLAYSTITDIIFPAGIGEDYELWRCKVKGSFVVHKVLRVVPDDLAKITAFWAGRSKAHQIKPPPGTIGCSAIMLWEQMASRLPDPNDLFDSGGTMTEKEKQLAEALGLLEGGKYYYGR